MTTQQSEPTLGEVQAKVCADHARIRTMLDELAQLARTGSVKSDDPLPSKPLTDAIWNLFLMLDEHLAMEERDLVPILERSGVWGRIPIERMHEEHRQQRTVLLAMVDESDKATKSPAEIADDARWLVDSLRRDMDHEDRAFECIRDDGFVADQATG